MTSQSGPLADVTAEQAAGGWTLVFVRDLKHPPDKVWAALTEPTQLREWAPFVPDRDLARTGPATLTMIDSDSPEDTAASVRRAERPTLLEYSWGEDLLRWELAPAPLGTRLTLRHQVADRELLSKVAAGWHLCLDVAERLLDGRPVPPIRGDDARNHGWDELNDTYAAKLAIPTSPQNRD
jgi:uncharacterized protein YndB with AHSA1/START domain